MVIHITSIIPIYIKISGKSLVEKLIMLFLVAIICYKLSV